MQSDDFNAFESKLHRCLMPVALSESATNSIHAMLDELAGEEMLTDDTANPTHKSMPGPWYAAAAAVAGLLAISAWFSSSLIEDLAYFSSTGTKPVFEDAAQSMHLVDESTHLAWFEDEGWLDDPDGGAMHAVRMGVIEENRLFDEETGLIVHVTSPREEMLLMPVSTF